MAKHLPKPDRPVPFGYKCAWYAVRGDDIDEVVKALPLKGAVACPWAEGIDAAYAEHVFVTPPLRYWILIAGRSLFYEGNSPANSVAPMLKRLSEEFEEAQYFATHRVAETHCWALARGGALLRAFAYCDGVTWSHGMPTRAELSLGRDVFDSPDLHGPNEDDVMSVAGAWSVNPCEIGSEFSAPGLGRLGTVA